MNESTSMVNRLQRLEQLVPQCEAIRKGAEYGNALTQATNEVKGAAVLPDRLERLEPALRILQGTQYLPAADLVPDIETLERVGGTLSRSVNTDALQDVRFWVKDIQEALQRLENQISRAWVTRVKSEFIPLQRLGSVLAAIPDTEATGQDIQKWATRTLDLANGGVPTVNTIREFNEAQAELPSRLKALGQLGVDVEVSSFLLEVANKRATLANVPPSVLDWLRAKHAQGRFRIELI